MNDFLQWVPVFVLLAVTWVYSSLSRKIEDALRRIDHIEAIVKEECAE